MSMDDNTVKLARAVFSGSVKQDTDGNYLLNDEGKKRIEAINSVVPEDLRSKYSDALSNRDDETSKKFIDAFERNLFVEDKSGAPAGLRFLIKNFGNDVNAAIEAADRWGYEARPSVFGMRSGEKALGEGIELDLRPKGIFANENEGWKRLDPRKIEFQDVSDLFADAIQTGADILAVPARITGLPGAALAGSVAAGTEAVRQGLGVLTGVSKEVKPEEIGLVGATATAIPAAGPLLRGSGRLAKTAVKETFRGVRNLSRESLDFLADNPGVIRAVESFADNPIEARQELARKTALALNQARDNYVTGINNQIDNIIGQSDISNKTVDARPILDKIDEQIKILSRKTTPSSRSKANEFQQVKANLLSNMDDDKRIFASEINELRKEWNDAAKQAFNKEAGQRLPGADQYEAISNAARDSLDIVDPKIRKINKDLKNLFKIEDDLKRFKFRKEDIPASSIETLLERNLNADESRAIQEFTKIVGLSSDTIDNPEFAKKAAKTIREIHPRSGIASVATGFSLLPLALGATYGLTTGDTGTAGIAAIGGAALAAPFATKTLVRTGTGITRAGEGLTRLIQRGLEIKPEIQRPIRRGLSGIISREVGREQ